MRQAAGLNVIIRDKTNAKDIFHMFWISEILSSCSQFANADGSPIGQTSAFYLLEAGSHGGDASNFGLSIYERCFQDELTISMTDVGNNFWFNPVFPAVMSGERFEEIPC